jgi:hypothetical protein
LDQNISALASGYDDLEGHEIWERREAEEVSLNVAIQQNFLRHLSKIPRETVQTEENSWAEVGA